MNPVCEFCAQPAIALDILEIEPDLSMRRIDLCGRCYYLARRSLPWIPLNRLQATILKVSWEQRVRSFRRERLNAYDLPVPGEPKPNWSFPNPKLHVA